MQQVKSIVVKIFNHNWLLILLWKRVVRSFLLLHFLFYHFWYKWKTLKFELLCQRNRIVLLTKCAWITFILVFLERRICKTFLSQITNVSPKINKWSINLVNISSLLMGIRLLCLRLVFFFWKRDGLIYLRFKLLLNMSPKYF